MHKSQNSNGEAYITLGPYAKIAPIITLPGSKSIANRALLLAALSNGVTTLHNMPQGEDVHLMAQALQQLGVPIQFNDERTRCSIQGLGTVYPKELGLLRWRQRRAQGRVYGNTQRAEKSEDDTNRIQKALSIHAAFSFPVKQTHIAVGNAGTVLRFLTAVLALCDGHYHLSGSARCHERPISDLVDSLRTMGAHIEYLAQPHYAPLLIRPFLANSSDELSIFIRTHHSSQFLSALLMAAPLLHKKCLLHAAEPITSEPYIQMTCQLMQQFGITVQKKTDEQHTIFTPNIDPCTQNTQRSLDYCVETSVEHAAVYKRIHNESRKAKTIPAELEWRWVYHTPNHLTVEGDASSASYFLAAAAISQQTIKIIGIDRNSIQGDLKFAEILSQMGMTIEYGTHYINAYRMQKQGSRPKPLSAFDLDANAFPDSAMTLAILALFTTGTCFIRNIGSWRFKETDRLDAMARELSKTGAQVHILSNDIQIDPPHTLPDNIEISTYQDHRIAMCFSLLALANIKVTLLNPDCVNKTFPNYFSLFHH